MIKSYILCSPPSPFLTREQEISREYPHRAQARTPGDLQGVRKCLTDLGEPQDVLRRPEASVSA